VATRGITPKPRRNSSESSHLNWPNTAASTSHVAKSHSSLLAEGGLAEWPVIMMLLEVTANAGQKIGTLIDLASDTNYITHEAAGRLNLKSEDITLVVRHESLC